MGGGSNSYLYRALVVDKPLAVARQRRLSGHLARSVAVRARGRAEPRRRVCADRAGVDARHRRIAQHPIRAEDLERVKTQLIAEAIYAQDNQATLARWYGGALTTGLSIEDIRSWPDRIRAVTAEQVRDAARKWLDKKRSVTGYLIKDTTTEARGEAFVTHLPTFTRRTRASRSPASFAFAAGLPAPSQAAAKIQHLISPGGIEAWFVQDATVPLIAMEYAFAGGAAQDPADKPGVGNMVASLSTRAPASSIPRPSMNGSTAAPSSSASASPAIISAAACAC